MSIYTPGNSEPLRLEFILERIYQRRDGATTVTADVLLKNTGNEAVNSFRVMLPYALAGVIPKRSHKTIAAAEEYFRTLQSEELKAASLKSNDLLQPEREVNWIYTATASCKIERSGCDGAKFSISRSGQIASAPTILSGLIKQGWTLKHPTDLQANLWLWLLFAANEITVLDLVAPDNSKEHLAPGQSMWIRCNFAVPPRRIDQKGRLTRLFARRLEFQQTFMSPCAVATWIQNRLAKFAIPQKMGLEMQSKLKAAQVRKDAVLEGIETLPIVKDWRIFLYREYSLTVQEPVQRAGLPKKPTFSVSVDLPKEADDKGCRRGPGPPIFTRLFHRGLRSDTRHEFWMGEDHVCIAPEGYVIEVTSFADNTIYNYLAWMGVLGFSLGVINFLRACRSSVP